MKNLFLIFFLINFSFICKGQKNDFDNINLSDDQKMRVYEYANKYKCSYFITIIDSNSSILDIDNFLLSSFQKESSLIRLDCYGVIKKIIDSASYLKFNTISQNIFFADENLLKVMTPSKTKFSIIFLTSKDSR